MCEEGVDQYSYGQSLDVIEDSFVKNDTKSSVIYRTIKYKVTPDMRKQVVVLNVTY